MTLKSSTPLARESCLIAFLLSVVFMALLSSVPVASNPAAAYADQSVVRVGYYENEVFQEGASPDAVKAGYAYEYYRKLSEYTGWHYEYVYGSYADLYQMLLQGDIDVLAGLARTEERAGLIAYPDAPMGHEVYSLVKHDGDSDITPDPATIAGKKIGVLDSAMVGVLDAWLASKGVAANVVSYPDYEELFAAFDAHDVDILAAEGDGAYGRTQTEVLCSFGSSDYYLCVSVKRPDLLVELDAAQAQLAVEEPNYLDGLRAKYYSASVSSRAFSVAEKEWLDDHDVLRVGYLNNYLPYSDTDSQGAVTGIVKDVVPEIFSCLGIGHVSVTYTGYNSYDRMIAAVNAGEIDVAFPVGGGLYYSEENGIYQSSPVVSAPTELVYSGAFSDKTTDVFAVNENNSMQRYYVLTNFPDAEVRLYPSIDECLAAVIDGKAGCTTINGLRANDILRNGKYRDLEMRQLSRNDDRSFGVRIGNEGLLKLVNRGVSVVGQDYAQNISYRYTEGLRSMTLLDFIREHLAFFAAVAAAVVAIIIALLVRDVNRSRREVRERDRAQAQLEAKNKELAESQKALSGALVEAEQANRAKTTFLNNMSHDIRTPMNAIVGFTGLAVSHIDDKEQVQDYLEKISVSSQHLLALINDVLDMSRIESGRVTIESADVHLPSIIHDIRTIVQPNADAKQLNLLVDAQGVQHESVVADKLRLEQVLLNILSNAVKFTPNGGTVSMRVLEKPSASADMALFEFSIKDTGIGMSEDFQETIFESFSRERTSTVSGIQGTGLGMAITKRIVDMMGGTIAVSSEVGKGSEFVVNLPLEISDSPLQVEHPVVDGEPASPQYSGKRILLVEDNEMNQMIATSLLEDAGFEVEVASDGLEAVEKMESMPAGRYDVVLMDVQMPRMDGYEAARRIRALDDSAKAAVPIVAVTANAFEEDRIEALEAGMNGFLAKPYDVLVIMETLASLLQ